MHVRVVAVAVLLPLLTAGVAHAPSRGVRVAHARPPVAAVPVVVAAGPAAEPRLVAPGGIEDARRWARGRAGTVGFAVADERGRVRGLNLHHRFFSASVVKAMLALAVVRSARERRLTAGERGLLHPMVTASENDAAGTVYAQIGAAPLHRIARAAGMRRFSIGGNWADAVLTPHDQARLFLRIDRLAPRRHRGYLRDLLGSIVPWQRWGIAPVAESRGFHVMFKGGWRTNIFHQVALLERDDRRVALAVLTSGTDHGYGRETEAGIASRVLSFPPRRPVAGGASARACPPPRGGLSGTSRKPPPSSRLCACATPNTGAGQRRRGHLALRLRGRLLRSTPRFTSATRRCSPGSSSSTTRSATAVFAAAPHGSRGVRDVRNGDWGIFEGTLRLDCRGRRRPRGDDLFDVAAT